MRPAGRALPHVRPPRRARALLAAVALVLLAGLAGGLSQVGAASPSPSGSAAVVTLRIGWTSEPDNLNPFIGWQNSTYEIWSLNYDFLFGFGDMGGEPTLDLAREFPTEQNGGISADGKVWTIKLRQGVKWSDGQPMTADDVAFTYNYIVKNRMLNMAVATVGIVGAEVLAPDVVQITCSRPKADMEHIFLPILPKHVWEDVDPKKAQTTYENTPPIVGTGPFITTAFKKGGYVKMERNPYYWGKRPTVGEILFLYYTNADSMTVDLKSGDIDAAWGIPEAQFDSLKSVSSLKPVPYNFFNWDYLCLNCFGGKSSLGNPVLKDWQFRRALNYAVDREKLCAIAYDGKATPGTTILPPDTWKDPDYHWQPPADQAYTFDLAKAGQLLDAAGYKLGAGGLRQYQGKPIKLRLWTTTDSPQTQTAIKLIAGWLQKLGLKIELSVIDAGALQAAVWNFDGDQYAPDFDMYVWDWAGYGDPGQTLSAETTAQIGNTNEPCWSNDQYDALNSEQAAAIDPETRKGYIVQMQQIMYEQTPWVVLTYPQYLEAYNVEKWTGWKQMMDGKGPAFFTTGNVTSYVDLQPVQTETSGGAKGLWVAVVVIVAVVIAVAALVLVRRRRPHAEEG
jgi:peptide/nickel transport system substrate-binding protein